MLETRYRHCYFFSIQILPRTDTIPSNRELLQNISKLKYIYLNIHAEVDDIATAIATTTHPCYPSVKLKVCLVRHKTQTGSRKSCYCTLLFVEVAMMLDANDQLLVNRNLTVMNSTIHSYIKLTTNWQNRHMTEYPTDLLLKNVYQEFGCTTNY